MKVSAILSGSAISGISLTGEMRKTNSYSFESPVEVPAGEGIIKKGHHTKSHSFCSMECDYYQWSRCYNNFRWAVERY